MHKVSKNSDLPVKTSFINVNPEGHFPIQNLPFGVFEHPETGESRCATAIGKYLVDLKELEEQNLFEDTTLKGKNTFSFSTLDLFISLGPSVWNEARSRLTELLSGSDPVLEKNPRLRETVFHLQKDVKMLLPVRIRDVTHSMNFKIESGGQPIGDKLDLQSDQTVQQIPVLSNGRISSVVTSSSDLIRPRGPRMLAEETRLTISPSRKLDVEMSVGYITGKGNEPGMPMSLRKAGESIFGYLMALNWIARDFITGYSNPVNYHKGRHIMSTISPWIITPQALDPFKIIHSGSDSQLKHLQSTKIGFYNAEFTLTIEPGSKGGSARTADANSSHLYWSPAQELMHHAVTGNRIVPGELFMTGPIISLEKVTEKENEIVRPNDKSVKAAGNRRGRYLDDGDTITAAGFAQGDGYRIGFGEVTGRIKPVI